ncbi:MAG: aromatic ring-hydroxylating dioxygenase subunit alpha [Chromatiales bacterium]|nr:aromatic ring-hydroxylating dioxygenase subunit alpha [Chromatiales bacterium]
MLFKNVWYVAARAEQLGNRPLGVRMLGRDFVLFRDQAGAPACLSSVCVHRGSSLARGKCQGDGTVSCPFHGWRFDAAGHCTRVPSQADPAGQLPPLARTDAYPAVERNGLIWVFLGDDLDAATPIPGMPEDEGTAYRRADFSDTWAANLHWSKMVDMDHVHLAVVHGVSFGGDNPFRPPDHVVETFPGGYRTEITGRPAVTKGSAQAGRTERSPVHSRLSFQVAGFTLRGNVEIGGLGTGFSNIFYVFSTPVDELSTRMHWVFFRNYMMEPENDKAYLQRNLKNIFQDKANAESILPPVPPDLPDWPLVRAEREDKLMVAYWQLMRRMRARGWEIDTRRLAELDQRGDYRVIPSPARRQVPEDWVYREVPCVAPGSSETRVATG